MIEVLLPAGVMGGLGGLLAFALLIAAKKFYVYEDPKIGVVEDLLPSANCGGCGKAGCRAFAEAIVGGEEGLSCPVASEDAVKAIAEVLGQAMADATPMVAHVMCAGTQSSAEFSGVYEGIEDCRAAHLVGQVDKVCSYGCIGLSSCVKVCAFDAIEIFDGIAHIIPENCVACGKCVDACPRLLIDMVPKGKQVFIPCKSWDAGKVVGKVCETGCIGCQRCVKECEYDAIDFANNLATINWEKCTKCEACIPVCPKNIIVLYDLATYVMPPESGAGMVEIAKAAYAEGAHKDGGTATAVATATANAPPKPEPKAEEDPVAKLSAKRDKIEAALAKARKQAEEDLAYRETKFPNIEAKFTEQLAKLTSELAELQAAAPKAAVPDTAALQKKYAKLLAALDKAKKQAEDDAEYRESKFPAISEKLSATIAKLEAELGLSGDTETKPEGEA